MVTRTVSVACKKRKCEYSHPSKVRVGGLDKNIYSVPDRRSISNVPMIFIFCTYGDTKLSSFFSIGTFVQT